MNNIDHYKSGKYLNLNSPNSKKMDQIKNISIKDFNHNKIPLIKPNKKVIGEFSFSFAQNNKGNNNTSFFPIKKIILHNSNNPSSEIESKNNYNQNKNYNNLINNNYTKLDISSSKQIPLHYNILNKETNYFQKNNINILKYINYKNILTRNDSNLSKKDFFSTRDYKKISESIDSRYDIVLKQRNSKNLNGCLLVNDVKFLESDIKNLFKNKSELNNKSKKIILPKVDLNHRKSNPTISKSNSKITETLSEKSNKMKTIINNKNISKILEKRKNIIKNLKKIKSLKHEMKLKLAIETLSIAGTNLNTKKLNQDSYFILPDVKINNNISKQNFVQIFGILDGHGDFGDIISKEIKEYFLEYFSKLNLEDNNNYEKLSKNNYEEIYNLFSEIDAKLHEKYTKENNNINICYNSGTTANIIILFKNKIISINLGHSKSIIIHKDKNIIQLNQCHTPELEEEKERIEKNGGEIKKEEWTDIGPKRICYKNDKSKRYSGLAVSRSFGDFYSEQLGIISVPEIKEYDIDYNNLKILVIATDGIWEFLTNEKVMDTIFPYYEENNISGGIEKLIKVGRKMWSVKNPYYIDDLSAIVVFFNN